MAEINLINQGTAVIDDGLPYKVVRNSIPNASYLGTKGDLFIGTGESNDITIGGDTYKLTKMGKLSVPTLSKEDVGEYILATDLSADNKIAWVSNTIIFESTNNKIQFIKDCLKLDEAKTNPSDKSGIMAGDGASAVGIGTIAIGTQANVDSSNGKAYENSIAMGSYAKAAGNYSIVMGSNAVSNGSRNVVIGAGSGSSEITKADGNNLIIIGTKASSDSNNSIVIGNKSGITGSTNGVLVGTTFVNRGSEQEKSSVLMGDNSVAIGVGISVTGNEAIGIATSLEAQAQGDDATLSYISGANSVGIGSGVTASNDSAIAIGPNTVSSTKNGIAIGAGAVATGVPSSIAIGAGATSNGGIQLGKDTSGSGGAGSGLKVYNYQLMNETGQVPKERLTDVYDELTEMRTKINEFMVSGNIRPNTSLSGLAIGYNVIYRLGRLCCFTDFVIKFNYASYTDTETTITLGTFDKTKFAPTEDRTWRGGIFENLGSATERVYEGVITVTKEGSINFTYTNKSRVEALSDSFFHISLSWYGAGV